MNPLSAPDPRAPMTSSIVPHASSGGVVANGYVNNGYVNYAGDDPPSGGLLEYWRILQRRRNTVILVACLGMIAGFLYTVPQTPIYQARSVIEVQPLNEDFLHMRDVDPNAAESSGWDPSIELPTQVRILQSRALIDRVEKKLASDSKPLASAPSRLDAWRTVLHLSRKGSSSSAAVREEAIRGAAGGLRIRAQANTRLIEILGDSTNPQIAADFVNTLTSEYIESSLEARWQATQHTGEWLAHEMEDTKIQLEKSDEALQNYARSTNLVITDEKDDAANLRLKQLQDELTKAQAERISRQSRYELAVHAAPDSLAEVLDDASLRDIQGKLTDLRRQLAELSSSLTPANPRTQKVQAQIAALEAAYDRERLNILGSIRSDFQAAETKEKLLAADSAATAQQVAQQADEVSHYNVLKRELDTNRQIYDSMLQRVQEASIASALQASNIRVVDPAVVPSAPYKPSLANNTVLGLFTGLFWGIVLVVFQDRADRTIQEPGDLDFYLGVPELGIVPSAAADPTRNTPALLFASKSGSNSNRSIATVALEKKPSAMAESFRATLTSILFSGENGQHPRVLVISSSEPKEGKTTLSTNLALAIAGIHKRVLLIDGDLRKPNVHRYFDVERDLGLVDLLRCPEPILAPLNGHVQPTSIPNLFVMTSGRPVDGDPTLLHSDRLAEVLDIARNEYDLVVIDTPPMLNMSDARVIARHADGVVLVARANRTSRTAIKDAARRFNEDGTRVLGAVLNDWDPKKSNRYGYYHYYERYKNYYGSSPTEQVRG